MPIEPTETLQALMQAAQVQSYRALAINADVSRWQIQQLRTGNGHKMRLATLTQLAEALKIPFIDFLQAFQLAPQTQTTSDADSRQLIAQTIDEQTAALQTLETWLVQWPTIAKRASEKGDALPAAKILPFIRPVEALMSEWDVEPIAVIDSQIPFDPQYHQLTQGFAQPGDLVHVTHTGQLHRGKLLHRARVKPTA
ncbi:MAG: helix-turn-helix transcriptional regulator [Cyanobacteria bacterium J06627_28]